MKATTIGEHTKQVFHDYSSAISYLTQLYYHGRRGGNTIRFHSSLLSQDLELDVAVTCPVTKTTT